MQPLWKQDPALIDDLKRRMQRLEQTVSKNPNAFINTKDMFVPFTPVVRKYLAEAPWEAFLKRCRSWPRTILANQNLLSCPLPPAPTPSPSFTRYAQWKHLEVNLKIDEEDFDVHRIIGRGGFGEVYPCRKRDTGAVYVTCR